MKIQKFTFRWVLAVCSALIFFASASPVFSQENITFTNLQIDLWPEYDEPEMLVVYRFQLSSQVQLPVELNIRIPAAAGNPSAVAEASFGNPLFNVPYTLSTEGNWTTIRFTANQPLVQVEYYDPSLEKDGNERTYVFRWPGGYDINQMKIVVQQPIGADKMNIFPSLNELSPDPQEGILYYSGDLGSYKAQETFERTIAYEKNSDTLTVEFLNIESPAVDEDTPGRISLVNIIPWGIGLLGVSIIAAGVYWYWATEKKQSKPAGAKVVTRPQIARAEEKRDIYCHQCGKRAEGADKFCRSCGTKLRI